MAVACLNGPQPSYRPKHIAMGVGAASGARGFARHGSRIQSGMTTLGFPVLPAGAQPPRERRKFFLVLGMVKLVAALETAGVVSIMPFLAVLGNPDIVTVHRLGVPGFVG